jgi:ParB-like chromosome segregation protein Spo0J
MIQTKTKKIRVRDCIPYERNASIHSPEQVELIKKSIEENGYISRIGVDKDNVIVFGHARHQAMMEKYAQTEIEVYDLSKLEDRQIKKLRIQDNSFRSQDIDEEKLIRECKEIFGDLEDQIDNVNFIMNLSLTLPNEIGLDVEKKTRVASEGVAQIILQYPKPLYKKVKELESRLIESAGITSSSDMYLYLLDKEAKNAKRK